MSILAALAAPSFVAPTADPSPPDPPVFGHVEQTPTHTLWRDAGGVVNTDHPNPRFDGASWQFYELHFDTAVHRIRVTAQQPIFRDEALQIDGVSGDIRFDFPVGETVEREYTIPGLDVMSVRFGTDGANGQFNFLSVAADAYQQIN